MKKIVLGTFTVILTTMLMLSCSESRLGDADYSKSPIVTVLENTLYMSDLDGLTHYGMSPEDSAAVTQTYIKMWINERLIYDKAKQNITNKRQIDDFVEEYRKSLIIIDYQTRLLKERLSKSIPDAELLAFFGENKERFKLTENVIQGLYLKVPVQSPQVENFQKWYKLGTDAAVTSIEENTLQNAIGYEYFYDHWVSFNDVMHNIPEILTDSEEFLKRNKTLEVRDSSFVYLLHIKEYKLIGSEAPYDFIKDNITDAYIEKKRDELLKQLQTDLYNKALADDQIRYYIK